MIAEWCYTYDMKGFKEAQKHYNKGIMTLEEYQAFLIAFHNALEKKIKKR